MEETVMVFFGSFLCIPGYPGIHHAPNHQITSWWKPPVHPNSARYPWRNSCTCCSPGGPKRRGLEQRKSHEISFGCLHKKKWEQVLNDSICWCYFPYPEPHQIWFNAHHEITKLVGFLFHQQAFLPPNVSRCRSVPHSQCRCFGAYGRWIPDIIYKKQRWSQMLPIQSRCSTHLNETPQPPQKNNQPCCLRKSQKLRNLAPKAVTGLSVRWMFFSIDEIWLTLLVHWLVDDLETPWK